MRRSLVAPLMLGICLVASGGAAYGQGGGERARELAARFDKDKHKVKERQGVRIEVFAYVHGEPAARRNAAEYSGSYEAEPGYPFDLRIAADGTVEGRGAEPASDGTRRFTLRDAKVSGAVLTGTKVYEDGATEPLEAAFINLTTRHSPTGKGTTVFGLGVVYDPAKATADGFEMQRLFYALER